MIRWKSSAILPFFREKSKFFYESRFLAENDPERYYQRLMEIYAKFISLKVNFEIKVLLD